MKVFKGRRLEVQKIHHASDPVDCFVESAFWTDTGNQLSEDELDDLNCERSDIAQDGWEEREITNAEEKAERIEIGQTYTQRMEEESRDAYVTLK